MTPTLRTNLQKRNSKLGCKLLACFLWYTPLIFHVIFSSYKHFTNFLRCMRLDLAHPSLNILERCGISDRICQYNSRSTFIVSLSNILKSLLACSVPYLHFYFLLNPHDCFYFKIDSNCCNIWIFKAIFTKSSYHVCLPHSAITYYYYFYQVICFALFHSIYRRLLFCR